MVRSECHTDDDQPDERARFRGRENVLNDSSVLEAPRVGPRERGDQQNRDDLRRGQRQRVARADVDWRNQVAVVGNPRRQCAQVSCEADRHRGDRARLDDEEQRPAVEESEQRPESFAQVNVLAARARHHGGKLSVGYSGHHGHEAAHRPGEEEQFGRLNLAGHIARHDENPRADHRAHHEGGRIEEAQTLDQLRRADLCRGVCSNRCGHRIVCGVRGDSL